MIKYWSADCFTIDRLLLCFMAPENCDIFHGKQLTQFLGNVMKRLNADNKTCRLSLYFIISSCKALWDEKNKSLTEENLQILLFENSLLSWSPPEFHLHCVNKNKLFSSQREFVIMILFCSIDGEIDWFFFCFLCCDEKHTHTQVQNSLIDRLSHQSLINSGWCPLPRPALPLPPPNLTDPIHPADTQWQTGAATKWEN